MRHGSQIDPPNPYLRQQSVPDHEHLAWDQAYLDSQNTRPIEYIPDTSQSIVSQNDSPDIPFRYSVNPYRGCAHGCAYCYARNSHEYLGFSAGLDFETKIFVKHDAARLLRDFLTRRTWQPEPITFSGVTDCYQPIERDLKLTRSCLEVLLDARQPVSIVTKNALVARDRDILASLAQLGLVHVFLSITSLDAELARTMEPRTSTPSARLRAVGLLREAGIPCGVMVAPVIPGLNDFQVPEVLRAAKEAGAQAASYVLLRLPLSVEPVFREWLQRTHPLQAERVEQRVRDCRGGQLNRSGWHERLRGSGPIAEGIRDMFMAFSRQLGLHEPLAELRRDVFVRPRPLTGQQMLFDA
jgi:DNA repair photolyase